MLKSFKLPVRLNVKPWQPQAPFCKRCYRCLFSAEYIAHILSVRRRIGEEPAALQLTRRADLLDLELPEPDLSIYDRDDGDDNDQNP